MITRYPDFVRDLHADVPVLQAMLAEHLEDYDDAPAAYLLLYDYREWALRTVDGDPAAVERLLVGLAAAVREGEPDVADCVGLAFLQYLPRGDEPGARVRAMLPQRLADELATMESD